jgi:hypothetical protein
MLRAADFLLHFAVQNWRIGPPSSRLPTFFQPAMQGLVNIQTGIFEF